MMALVQAQLQVHDAEGRLVRSYCTGPDDLATDQLTTILEAFLGTSSGSPTFGGVTDVGGVDRTIRMWSTSGVNIFCSANSANGISIGIGDGGGSPVTPDRADYELVNKLDETGILTSSSGSGSISASGAIVNGSGGAWTVREVCLYIKGHDSGGTQRQFMLFFDSTANTTVNDGETVTVTYTVTFP